MRQALKRKPRSALSGGRTAHQAVTQNLTARKKSMQERLEPEEGEGEGKGRGRVREGRRGGQSQEERGGDRGGEGRKRGEAEEEREKGAGGTATPGKRSDAANGSQDDAQLCGTLSHPA